MTNENIKKWIIIISKYVLTFLVVASISAFVTFKVLSSGLTVEVPNIEGRTLTDARESLESKGLLLKVKSETYDLGVPAGRIISQDVQPGSNVRGEVEVKVVVSKGPEVRLIPSVIGETMDNAREILMKERLTVDKIIHVHSDTISEDTIIAQKPLPEEWTGEGITLVASAGAYDIIYYSPFFQGMVKEDALLLASELGLNVKLRVTTGSDIVINQNPSPGMRIKRGETISLILGQGN
jgi:serine/threonine-protein kinase